MRTTSKFGTALAALAAAGALTAAGAAHAAVTVLTTGSFDATPDHTYQLTPYDVMPGTTSSASATMNAPAGTSTYDFTFMIDKSYGTTAFGSFGFDNGGNALSDANLQLFSGSPDGASGSQMFITGIDYDPATDPQQSIQANLNAGTYFVQATVKNPRDGGGSTPITFSASVHAISAAPEPSTWLLMMAGVGGLGLALRSQRRRLGSLLAA